MHSVPYLTGLMPQHRLTAITAIFCQIFYYLRQGGYAFAFACLFVCLSVHTITELKKLWTNVD